MPIVYHVFFVEIRLTSSQLALIRQYISLHSRSNAVSNQVREILKQQNLGGGQFALASPTPNSGGLVPPSLLNCCHLSLKTTFCFTLCLCMSLTKQWRLE